LKIPVQSGETKKKGPRIEKTKILLAQKKKKRPEARTQRRKKRTVEQAE